MPRIRTIKPDFFSNEQIGQLSAEARLLFVGLWTLADREGRLQDRPVRIGAQLFPYDSWPIGDLLENLDEANLIHRYEVEGKKCIQIVNFLKHQYPHPKETKYDLPPPPKLSRVIPGNSREVTEITPPCPVDNGVMDHGLMEHGAPSVLARREDARAAKSRFALKDCEKYAKSKRNIKFPTAFAKSIWQSGEADDEIAAFQAGHSGKPMKKAPDKPVDVAAMQRLADELERMELKEQAAAVRAGIEASK